MKCKQPLLSIKHCWSKLILTMLLSVFLFANMSLTLNADTTTNKDQETVIKPDTYSQRPIVKEPLRETNEVMAQTPIKFPLLEFSSWSLEDRNWTSMAWGDVDGDGDFDLAVGSGGNVNGLYLNENGALQTDLAWSSRDFDFTSSMAWGDVDGDGDLDLAVGNQGTIANMGGPNKVYLNLNGVLQRTATWSSGDLDNTSSIAWGDVDGDGDLDLAVGNMPAYDYICDCFKNDSPNKLYLNKDGILQTNNIWASAENDNTYSVAWGDIDGDGDLDLAVGNYGQANKVYLNEYGALQSTHAWSSGDFDNTHSVAWGDVDGDGDLDLAVGNEGAANKLYLNANGVLQTETDNPLSWGEFDDTYSVAWGDVDGDGDLDLAVGNSGTFGRTNKVYLNESGVLQTAHVWASSEQDRTYSVVWADIDGDGGLDLAVGNEGTTNKVYLNTNGVLQTDSAWSSDDSNRTESVAWGDVDGDGDLDLAVGNSGFDYNCFCYVGETNKVYLNDNGVLQTTVTWSSNDSDATSSVAWGDIDGDGYLDLAVGNNGQGNKVYLNENGVLRTTATWSSNDNDQTQSVAWGDVDGDGDLDLAVGNWGVVDGVNKLYLNNGGVLQTTASWTSDDSHDTTSIAWGDVDGDGDLDLAVGNNSSANKVYLNENGILQTAAVWSSYDQSYTQSVAWGDVDGDGDLDLATGNYLGTNKVYINENGVLQNFAAWVSHDSDYTYSVAWGDVDGDGDLDLAAGNLGSSATKVYLNKAGTLQTATENPWLSDDSDVTYSVAWGDVDGDGDLDLAAGNWGGANKLYLNGRGSHDLPITAPLLTISHPSGSAATNFYGFPQIMSNNIIPITYDLFDYEGDTVGEIQGEYSLNGGGQWFPAVATTSTITTNLNTAPSDSITTTFATDNGASGNMFDLTTVNETGIVIDRLDLNLDLVSNMSITIYYKSGSYIGHETNPDAWTVWTSQIVNGQGIAKPTIVNVPDLRITASETYGIYIHTANNSLNYTSGANVYVDENVQLNLGIGLGGLFGTSGIFTPRTWNGAIHYRVPHKHTFYWNTFASGFFGRSDNVVFRIEAYPLPATPSAVGSYKYPNSTPSPTQRPYVSTTTFPFRVRGTQVRTIDKETESPIRDAVVYRVKADGSSQLMANEQNRDAFLTAADGYLHGRGRLDIGDQLIALKSVSPPSAITFTDKIDFYHTSAATNESGLDLFTVENPGVQQLVISSDNQLMLLNLSVSLEWDASKDVDYLARLEQDIKRASEILFDLTNGQVALGEVTVYQNKENWNEADIVVYASNTQRPNANLGGIVTDVMSDVNAQGEEIPFAFLPGQIRMPPVWNRYGNPEGTIGEDWPRVLAHEIGHYALFMIDNYLGLDGNNQLINIDCQGSAMTDAYRQDYSEFLTAVDWTGDCLNSVAEKAIGRSDWETILLYYGSFLSNDQTSQTGDGPRTLPIAVTQVVFSDPEEDTSLLETPFFYLSDEGGETLAVNRGQATGYLLKPYDLSTLEDDVLVPLGSPVGPLLQARGAQAGDTLCVYDYSTNTLRTGCLEGISNLDSTLLLEDVPSDWSPEILVTPLDETQFQVTVNQAGAGDLEIQIYPTFRPTDTVKALVQTVSPVGDSYSATYTFPLTVFSGHVRVYEVGSNPRKETIIPFSITPKWDGNGFISWGGNQIQAWDGNGFISWGGNGFISWGGNGFISWGGNGFISWGAPVVSSDGQVTLFDTENIIGGGNRPAPAAVMQAIQDPPNLPPWFTPVGQAYRYDTDGGVDEGLVILFRYLERELPLISEQTLSIYHLPVGATEWQKLETTIDPQRNQASAAMQSTGTYVLIATVELPPFDIGWNFFGYPLQETRPVTTALSSIDGKYSSIYELTAQANTTWKLYDPSVVIDYPDFATYVNDLHSLEFAKSYAIYAVEPVTTFLEVQEGTTRGMHQTVNYYPPATYFGPIRLVDGLMVEAGMSVEAWIGDTLCGQSTIETVNEQLVYKIQVSGDFENGCGNTNRLVSFTINGQVLQSQRWDNHQANYLPIPPQPTAIYLPLIRR